MGIKTYRANIENSFLAFKQKYEKYFPAAFFLLGLLFDIVTVERIDHVLTLIQQATYLAVISGLVIVEFLENNGRLLVPLKVQKLWQYKEEIIHFLFGSLLSAFTIFYFKSASLLASFLFFGAICVILVINEVPRFQKLGLSVRFALLSLCYVSYFAYLIPILLGFVGIFPFLLAILMTVVIFVGLYFLFKKKLRISEIPEETYHKIVERQVVRPAVGVLACFFLLYILQLIPPVPLSVNYQGIYHSIEKKDGKYVLYHLRPWWKFWENGDQTFYARPGDKIYYFATIFSPTSFRDQIRVRWLYRDRNGWQKSDAIPISIVGGRDDGFRGFTYKENYQTGDWRVQLETTDGREIGRLYLTVKNDTDQEPREFKTDVK